METDKITSSYRKNLGETQFVVDVTLQNTEDNAIDKVLTANCDAFVDEVEMLNGEAHYSGATTFNLLFADENGECHVLSNSANINGKIENDQINPLMKPIFEVEIVEIKVDSVDDNQAKLSATVTLKLDAVAVENVEEVKVDNANIQLNPEHVNLNQVVSTGTKTFELAEEYDTKQDIKRVLLTSSHVELKNVTAGTGYFTVEGNLFVNSLLEVQTDEGLTLKNFMQTLPFKEELEDEFVQKDDEIFASVFVRPQDVNVEVVTGEVTEERETELGQTLKIGAEITVRYIAQRMTETEVYTDAFSMTNKINLVSETFRTAKPTRVERFGANVEGQTVLDDDEPRIAKICAVTNEHLTVANSVVSEGKLTIEGVAYATIIYLTDDDVPTLSSVDLEIPFSNKFEFDTDFEGELYVASDITDVDAKVKKGKEINVNLDVCFLVYGYAANTQVAIKDIELTEELPQSEYSLEMYIAPKGSTLWDVSKHMLVTENVLLEQNPELVFPLEEAKTIVHFKQK